MNAKSVEDYECSDWIFCHWVLVSVVELFRGVWFEYCGWAWWVLGLLWDVSLLVGVGAYGRAA